MLLLIVINTTQQNVYVMGEKWENFVWRAPRPKRAGQVPPSPPPMLIGHKQQIIFTDNVTA